MMRKYILLIQTKIHMHNHLFNILYICCALFLFCSCEKNEGMTNGTMDEITIYGNVIDRATGQPLYNVLIREKNKVGGSSVTGNDGNYEFTLPLNGSSNGKYYLVASKSLYSDSEYELVLGAADKGRKIKIDFQLETGVYYIKGKVTDINGAPIRNALIKETYKNTGNSVYSDKNGDYELELYPYSQSSNKYVLTASITDYFQQEYVLNFTEKDYGRTSTVNFQLESSIKPTLYCYIKGTCKGTAGARQDYANKRVPGLTIRGYKATKSDYSDQIMDVITTTDSYGNYNIKQEIDPKYPYHYYAPSVPYDGLRYVVECNGESKSSFKIELNESDANKTYRADFSLW